MNNMSSKIALLMVIFTFLASPVMGGSLERKTPEVKIRALDSLVPQEVASSIKKGALSLRDKEEEVTDVFSGFEFVMDEKEFEDVNRVLGLKPDAIDALYKSMRDAAYWKMSRDWHPPKHPWMPALLLLQGKSLDNALDSLNSQGLPAFAANNAALIEKVTESLSFHNIYMPAKAFSGALAVFGANVSAEALYELAKKEGYNGMVNGRLSIRGDFGIALLLVSLVK